MLLFADQKSDTIRVQKKTGGNLTIAARLPETNSCYRNPFPLCGIVCAEQAGGLARLFSI